MQKRSELYECAKGCGKQSGSSLPIIIGIVMPKFGLLKVAKFVGITYIVENLRTELASSTKLIFRVNDILLAS